MFDVMGLENMVCLCKQDIIFVLLKKYVKSGEEIFGDGVLEIFQDGFGFLCFVDFFYLVGFDDIYVLLSQIWCFNLCMGDIIIGKIWLLKEGECYFVLFKVDLINFDCLENVKNKIFFENLMLLFFNEWMKMEVGNGFIEDLIGCVIDFCVLIGKGQCGLIVVLLKVGKIIMLQNIVSNIICNNFECYLIVLLIDECFEEVIEMQCIVCGEVVVLIFDELLICYVQVVEMVIEKVKCLVEYKKDVVILFDFIICLVWVYNIVIFSFGKVFIGGVDVYVLEKLKCFFGVVWNIEEGGFFMIFVMVLVEIGLKMDEVIYEEFKGIGNMEFLLDCKIVEKCVFLVININCLGICCEELLISEDEFQCMWILCKILYLMDEIFVIEFFIDKFKQIKINDEFFDLMK